MGTTIGGVNIVGKGQHQFIVAVGILHGNFRCCLVILCHSRTVDYIIVNDLYCFFLVDKGYEAANTAFIVEIIFDGIFRIS